MKPILEGITKLVENNLEDRKLNEIKLRTQLRNVLIYNVKDVISNLVLCKLVDDNEFVKKGRIDKKVVGN